MTVIVGPSNLNEIREDLLTDQVLEASKFGIVEDVRPGSDNYIQATGFAGALMFAHARIDTTADEVTPLNCSASQLEDFRVSLGLPEATPSQAGGKVRLTVAGSSTVPNGQLGTLANGSRFSVVGTWAGVVNGSEVDVLVTVAGSRGNAKGGTKAALISPPINVSQECLVSNFEPIKGGFDEESTERKRARVLSHTGASPGGGNWGQKVQTCYDTSQAVQQAYCYPTLGGPGTDKTVVLSAYDRDLLSYSREYPGASLSVVRDAIQALSFTGASSIVDTVADYPVDASVAVTIPASALIGGDGSGWLDQSPWPVLDGDTRVSVDVVSADGTQVTLGALTAVSPAPSYTRIAWWSPVDMSFCTRTVIAVSGGTGAWIVTLDSPFVDSTAQGAAVGDYVSPAAQNIQSYGEKWVELLEALGPAENTADPIIVANGRGLRHPFQASGKKSALTSAQLNAFSTAHSEIEDIAWSYRSATAPPVPGAISDPPNVFVPRRFGVYPQ
jgi:hypothetical protein